ncbi:MAG TPA: PEP-CTERM sorting domain-containing protein [Pyrinomonadaceae bacterium]|nr:PEP-CTERM sorting domain-containing protein [Pyrinomonadaceae bacterium]
MSFRIFRPSLAIVFCLLAFAVGSSANADTITFDAPASPGSVPLGAATFQGFTFASAAGFNHVASGHFSSAVSHNATSFLVVSPNATGTLIITNGGAAFSASSFDADTFTHILGATTITVTGTLVGGGTISQTFVTDAVGDGPGPNVDFQTFSLVGFNDLISLQFTSVAKPFALDNLNLSGGAAPVPEPATMLLLGSGLSALAAFARKRRN